jgi:hypothetical protein
MKQIPQNKSASAVNRCAGCCTTGDLVAGDLFAAPLLFVVQTIVFQSSAALDRLQL